MSNFQVVKWIAKKSKSIFWQMSILVVMGSALSLFSVVFALISKDVIDIAAKQKQGNLLQSFAFLVAMIILQMVLHAASSSINVRSLGKLEMKFKRDIFSSVLKKQWKYASQYHSGDVLARMTNDVNVVTDSVINLIPNFFFLLVSLISAFVMMYIFDHALALIILAVGPFVFVFARIFGKKMKSLHKQHQQSESKVRSYVQECLQNSVVIKSFKNEDNVADAMSGLQNDTYKLKIKRNTLSIVANLGIFLVFSSGYYFALAWGAYKLYTGAITFGTLTAVLQLVSRIQSPFKSMSGLLPQLYSTIASAERIIELENLPDEQCDKQLDCKALYEKTNALVIKDLSFAYDDEPVFEHAGLIINKGEFVAIAGMSGIGKSTLLKIILNLISPSEGEMYFDTSDGRVDMNVESRGMFAYVPQGNMILSGTIRDNICFYNKNVTNEQILRCVQIAQMTDFVNELEDGLDTALSEGGAGLSEGQIQRIAIARAILYDAPILLLDEATSALDEQTELAVLRGLKTLKDKSCIIVSHKKAAFDICDKVIHIKDGKILSEK